MGDLYNMVEMLKYRGRVVKIYEGTVIASGNNHGTDEVDVLAFKEGSFFIHCSAITTTGNATVTVETRHPNPDIAKYEDLASFSGIAVADATEQKDVSANLGEKLSLKWDLASTTSFTFSVYAVLKIM